MKKKIVPIMLVITMLAVFLTGCNLVTLNKDRDNKQAITTVHYNGLSSEISKGDLRSIYDSYGALYIKYMGYTAEKAYNTLAEKLAEEELVKLIAIDELTKNKNLSLDKKLDPKDAQKDVSKILRNDEINEAVRLYNESMDKLMESFKQQIQAEKDASAALEDDDDDKPAEEPEKIERPEPRKTRKKDADKAFVPGENDISKTDIDKTFEIIWKETEHDPDSIEVEAKRRLDKRLKKLGKTYNDFYEEKLDSVMLGAYRRLVTKDIKVTPEELNKKIEQILLENKETFGNGNTFNEEEYKKAIAGNFGSVVLHPNDYECGYVFNILLKFDDEWSNLYKQYKKNGLTDSQMQIIAKEYAKNITVNISNLEYNPDGKCVNDVDIDDEKNKDKYGYHKCDDPNCPLTPFTRYDVPVMEVIQMINDDLIKIKNNAELTDTEKAIQLRETFTQWMYRVNDDPGMFDDKNANGYLVPKEGKSSYVKEFTEQARNLLDEGVGAYRTGNNSDYSDMYVVTEFGIHIIMVSSIPSEDIKYEKDSSKTLNEVLTESIKTLKENELYQNNLNNILKKNKKYSINKEIYKDLIAEATKK